jgi:hypothetical protein
MSAGRYVPAFFMSIAVLSAAALAAPTPITPQLVDAAKHEGKVVFYTSLACPFLVEQVVIPLWRILGLDELGVVRDRRRRKPLGREIAVGIALIDRPFFRHFRRHKGRQPTLSDPIKKRHHIRALEGLTDLFISWL